jgi:single-stranded DNA-specific DHH superfamily exonuclease
MAHFDVFNGDADGLCSLHQLRLEEPLESVLVTGVKRDIVLLGRVDAQRGDVVTVLDISAASNRAGLNALLERGVEVHYFDHHFAGELPEHPGLTATIDTSPGVCTGMLVDRFLQGRRRIWAVVAAFGDNLEASALALAAPLRLAAAQLDALRELGESLAYNAYGDTEADLIAHPAELYRTLARYADPFRMIAGEPLLDRIGATRRDDLARAAALQPEFASACAAVYVLPDAAWSRRVRGALANVLANRSPDLAYAILTRNAEGGFMVSVRAPRARPNGADALCRAFATGGGRAAAAGINHLPEDELPEFVRRLERAFG